jgi:hypothetical protein
MLSAPRGEVRRRTSTWPRHHRRTQRRRATHAPGRDQRLAHAQISASTAPDPYRERPRQPRLHPGSTRHVLGHRHHRTPHPRRQGLLRRRPRQLLPPGRRLVHRRVANLIPGHQRTQHGHQQPATQRRHRHSLRSRGPRQFTSWAFTERARKSGLVPSMGTIGDCYDNGMISRSGAACKPSSSTGAGGRPASNSRTRSSTTSRSSTTGNAATAPSGCSPRSSMKGSARSPYPRHETRGTSSHRLRDGSDRARS